MWTESTTRACAWTYTFDFLKKCIAQATSVDAPFRTEAAPQFHHRTLFVGEAITKPMVGLTPTTRSMWNGRVCVLSLFKTMGHHNTFFYSLAPDGVGPTKSSTTYNNIELANYVPSHPSDLPLGQTDDDSSIPLASIGTSVLRKTFIYDFGDSKLMYNPVRWNYLYALGKSGKNAAWLEELSDGTKVCRLAAFDHEDDAEEGPVTRTVSTIDFEHPGFDWTDVLTLDLDDAVGILAFVMAGKEVWKLYFD